MAPDKQMHLFERAQTQIKDAMAVLVKQNGGPEACHAGIVSLGDLGDYHHGPGSSPCFQRSKEWLDRFQLPVGLITGNHDLEGLEFETDEDNLEAWRQTFQQREFWRADVGAAILLGLGTTRFRDNAHCAHEVWIDDAQVQWFREQLTDSQDRPVIVFSHAPIMGSGLKVVHRVHVKSRCAYLNHSTDPGLFLRLVKEHPNICLWFSGHFHLSHDYPGQYSHDWRHNICTDTGFNLFTLDHNLGRRRLDLARDW
ncbi:hypothetical protein QBZ16_000919 [Prototheca wickerhamii]|uniref:Calcineurin-like phosphoesterase domain-containing protein n=1 Tax=Prototheca wickerhamii TaxID=3111 RepID=A0AAD9MGA2_PROWI|nr:hypothetical protein QBZ16_000919 [Prototheca wickerhamii]